MPQRQTYGLVSDSTATPQLQIATVDSADLDIVSTTTSGKDICVRAAKASEV